MTQSMQKLNDKIMRLRNLFKSGLMRMPIKVYRKRIRKLKRQKKKLKRQKRAIRKAKRLQQLQQLQQLQ